MPAFICSTCGTQYPPSDAAPAHCPVCEDERQHIPPGKHRQHQRSAGKDDFARRHRFNPGVEAHFHAALLQNLERMLAELGADLRQKVGPAMDQDELEGNRFESRIQFERLTKKSVDPILEQLLPATA